MKILYVSRKYDYGKPERGFNYQHYNYYDTFVKMNSGEHQVIYFPLDEIIQREGKEGINEKLLEVADKEKPDLFFFAGGEIKKETIGKITQKSKTITLIWMSDDHWAFDNSSRHWAPYFNWVATTDSQAPAKYYKIGYKNVIHSQWACNHFCYKYLDLPKIYDVSFVGHPHGNRKKIVKKIRKAGINIKCWGSGWPNGRASQEEMIRIFSQSKINLNFTMSGGLPWKKIASIFLKRGENRIILVDNPKNWLSNFKSMLGGFRKQIKGRNFEIAGSGGFCLTKDADNLEDYYEIGKEMECFHSTPELIEKIKYYLAHDKERETIAKAGYERTLRDHTFEKRFNDIFKIIGLTK